MATRRLAHTLAHLSTSPTASVTEALPLPAIATADPSLDDIDMIDLDPAAFLASRLSPAERAQFAEEGYLHLKAVLNPTEITALTAALDHENAIKLQEHALRPDPSMDDAMYRMGIFTPANTLSNQPCVQKLLTTEGVLAKVVDILGWNISVYHAHANITPPPGEDGVVRDGQYRAHQPLEKPPLGEENTFGFHQDTGRINNEMETSDGVPPRVSLKAAFYLTDVELSEGPTWIIPGSHRIPAGQSPEYQALLPPDGKGQPTGAIPVLAKAGDVLIFDRRLRHAATSNWSNKTRKAYFVGFSYRWLKPKDAMYVADIMPTLTCPVTRQLLGDSWSNNGMTGGTPKDVPLFLWLQDKAGIDPASTGLEGKQGLGAVTTPSGPQNYGRLQGDVGHVAGDLSDVVWGVAPDVIGGYAANRTTRDSLMALSKEELVEIALRSLGPKEV